MMIQAYIGTYAAILLSYMVVEALWLGVIAKASYMRAIGHLMRQKYPTWPWMLFYLLYSGAVLLLAVISSLGEQWYMATVNGAILGMAAYGAYNLTNYAILESWPLHITLKDWAWGTSITALTSTVGWYVLNSF